MARVLAAVATAAALYPGVLAFADTEDGHASGWVAASHAELSLAPLLEAGGAGWCMEVAVRAEASGSGASALWCSSIPVSSGPIYAAMCAEGSLGSFVFLITARDVASVAVAGSPDVATLRAPSLPGGLRTAVLEKPRHESLPGYVPLVGRVNTRCPSVAAFDAEGRSLPMRSSGHAPRMAARLPTARWEGPVRARRSPCGLRVRQGPTVAISGAVVREIRPVRGLLGQAFLSCANTLFRQGEEYVNVAILLDATHPGATPPRLPGMRPLKGHPGTFRVRSSGQMVAAHRIPHAWLVASHEGTESLAGSLAILRQLHTFIRLRNDRNTVQ